MKKKAQKFVLLSAILLMPVWVKPQVADSAYKPGWKLVFNDEFNKPNLDKTKWMQRFPWGPCLANNLAYFTEGKNISFTDGMLKLTAINGPVKGPCWSYDSLGKIIEVPTDFEYASGMLYSTGTFKYGYYECRFRVPAGKGFNSSFWLYGEKSSEIDVFEILGSKPQEAQLTIHWQPKKKGKPTQKFYKYNLINESFDRGFHTMAVDWQPSGIKWYLDGKEINPGKRIQKTWNRHNPNVPMAIILDLGIGIMEGKPDNTTPFPSDFIVDYVRAYRQDTTLAGPEIIGQRTEPTWYGNPVLIRPEDLEVRDATDIYPSGYRIKILEGLGYTANGTIVTPVKGFKGALKVRLTVNDGQKDSNIYEYIINEK